MKRRTDLNEKLGLGSHKDNLDQLFEKFCSHSTDEMTGQYKPNFEFIDGPANIRKEPSNQSEIIGKCSDNSPVVILNDSHLKWSYVYCGGFWGWTAKTNLRSKNQ